MSRLRRIADLFVVPGDGARDPAWEQSGDAGGEPTARRAPSGGRTPPGVAVLTAAADAPATGAALGLALARRERAPVAAVCVLGAGGPGRPAWRAPAHPAARRLAAALAARGHDARAAGRLALVRVVGSDCQAASDARRVLAAAAHAPAVLALGGPRSVSVDALLADQDLVVVAARAGADPVLTRLAVDGLSAAVRACRCEVPAAPVARALAAAGLVLLPSARRALAAPLEGLP